MVCFPRVRAITKPFGLDDATRQFTCATHLSVPRILLPLPEHVPANQQGVPTPAYTWHPHRTIDAVTRKGQRGCGRYSVAVVPQRIAAVHGPNPHDRHALAGGSLKRRGCVTILVGRGFSFWNGSL